MRLEYYDEIKSFTQKEWDYLIERMQWGGYEPQPGDPQYIGDDEEDNPVYVEMDDDVTPMFMGEVDSEQVWTT